MSETHEAGLDPARTVNLAVQVLPLAEDAYPVVDAAIAAIDASGLRYQVGPMETVMEGPLDRLLEAARAAHLACFRAGADRVVTILKIEDARAGASMDAKLAPYRDAGRGPAHEDAAPGGPRA